MSAASSCFFLRPNVVKATLEPCLDFVLSPQTILGEIRDEDDEILPRKDYEVRKVKR